MIQYNQILHNTRYDEAEVESRSQEVRSTALRTATEVGYQRKDVRRTWKSLLHPTSRRGIWEELQGSGQGRQTINTPRSDSPASGAPDQRRSRVDSVYTPIDRAGLAWLGFDTGLTRGVRNSREREHVGDSGNEFEERRRR